MAVALSVGNRAIMATSAAILAVGMLRVASAVVYRRYKKAADQPSITKRWEHVYEAGAWAFSGLLGLLCWLTLMQTTNSALQMAVITTATGYAAAIAGRNAGRPFIAVGQLTFIMLPMVIALLIYPEWIHKVLGVVGVLFIFATVDITLSIRDIIIQALTMTRKEAALAARFEEQAKRFDVALNNMSHGLCMLDQHDRLQVWNERFLELLHLQNVPVRVGMGIPELVRHSIRAGNHKGRSVKQVFRELSRSLQLNSFDQVQTAPDGERSIALSRRVMADGGSVIILEDVTERKRAQERISHLARYDELTGLANRSQFRERINDMLAELDDRDNCLTIHLIDLDRFKSVNDTLGHPIGDKLLREVAARLSEIIRPSDMITRFGGDEFVVLQTGTARQQEAQWLAERLAKALAEPFDVDGHRIDIGASIGIAMAPGDGVDADELLKKADMALYVAKNGGGGNHCFFAAEMEEAVQARRALELDLRGALGADQFKLHFQPLVDLRTGRITTCEALVRWVHPVRGNVPPAVFIPIAEETGLIIELGQWVMERACEEAASWPHNVKVAVNLVAGAIPRPRARLARDFGAGQVRPARRSGWSWKSPSACCWRKTTARSPPWSSSRTSASRISLDDFGTGYSSLNYLRKFPFHKIKIDQSFIRDLGEKGDARPIIGAVASLGAGLDKIVVAEGIETEEQMALVRAQGCHEGQGHYFGRPMSGEAIRARLASVAGVAQKVA